MENIENLTIASGKQGAHNMPCKRCGKINWIKNKDANYAGFPMWDCKTKNCDGILWSD